MRVTSNEGPSGYEGSQGKMCALLKSETLRRLLSVLGTIGFSSEALKKGSGLHSREDEESKLLLLYFTDFKDCFFTVFICEIEMYLIIVA